MRRTVLLVLVLFLFPTSAVLGQESRQSRYTITKDGKIVPSTAQGTSKPSQPLTNESIIKLVRAKLAEDTVINIVNTQPGAYRLGADEIIALKKAGVSEKIITAMLNMSASSVNAAPSIPAGVTSPPDQSPIQLTSREPSSVNASGQVPQMHGLYYQDSNKLVTIEGQVISFARSGSLLASAVTIGIKSRKINVQILGEKAVRITGTQPLFHYRAAQGAESAGGSAGDLVLVHMSVSRNRRQFEVGADGAWRASSGISIRSQLPITRKQIEPDLYDLTPNNLLKPGQYGLYLFRGYDLPGYVYDFSVE